MNKRLLDDVEFVFWLSAMARAQVEGDEQALAKALMKFEGVRSAAITTQVRRIANDMKCALDHFHADARLLELAQKQMPDARLRLAHVLKLTDDAAHRTLDLVERSAPLADHAAQEAQRLIASQQEGNTAFVKMIATSMAIVRSNLAEVLMAQGFQDLSGQIIRSVMKLIQDLDVALSELLHLTGPDPAAINAHPAGVQGPQVPGIPSPSAVDGQQDVDALLSQLGV